MKPRILLVDDHEVVRAGIASLLESHSDICGEASNGLEAVQKVRELHPDLVLLDLGMPVMGGTAAAREIRRIAPDVKIVFLSMHERSAMEQVNRLVKVDAYLTKGCSSEQLKKTITDLLNPSQEEQTAD